jgi:hypothetical protein
VKRNLSFSRQASEHGETRRDVHGVGECFRARPDPLFPAGAKPRACCSARLDPKFSFLLFARTLLLVALTSFVVSPLSAETESTLVVGFPDIGTVSRVYIDGRIERIEIPGSQPRGGSVAYGSDLPSPSPDNKYIAFVRDNELWILDVQQRTTRKIAPAQNEKTKIDGMSITAWSWDSRLLLYYLQPLLRPDASHQQIVGSMISADAANFRIYDLNSAETEQVTLPGRFAAWLSDRSLILIPTQGKAWQPLWRWRSRQESPEVFVSEKASYSQLRTSRDGSTVMAVAHFKHDTSEIVKIDVSSRKLTRIVPVGSYAQYQLPTLSPSGRRLGYLLRRGDDKGVSVGDLIVDGKAVARYTQWPQFDWINEEVVFLRDNCRLSVIDLKNHRVVLQQKIPTRNEESRERYCRALEAVK